MTPYGLPFHQVLGPPWIDSERYDIVAKVPAGATKEQVNVMLQNQEQLGLRLKAKTGPFDVVVVDHREKTPTEN